MADEVRLLHFVKHDQGYRREYVVLLESGDETPASDHQIAGFELESETEIIDAKLNELPVSLPYSETLMKGR